jgi:carboxypeptidase C (cathepsin A)
MPPLLFVFGALAASLAAAADPVADRVLALPRWSDPFRSARYSGYVAGSDASRRVSYFFVESESSPATDKLVVWLNGGPGCSSQIGLWLEQGPLLIGSDGALTENAGRWNAHANVLYLESPPGVGWSHVEGAAPPYAATDNSTAADSLGALRDFFAAFPSFSGRDLWLTGESYAGIYIPFLARAILASGDARLAGSLRGLLVGNGANNMHDGATGLLDRLRMEHASGHGLFSAALRARIDATCTNWTLPRPAACESLLDEIGAQVGPLNNYNIEETCLGGGASPQARALLRSTGAEPRALRVGANACTAADDALTAYLNLPAVQAALHVNASGAVAAPWAECAGARTLNYTRFEVDEATDVYPALLAAGLHVLIFNGDQDECIPYNHDEAWTAGMGLAVRAAWRPWVLDEAVAGYVTEYDAPGRFAFATVKRAGHEVPKYQPARALAMLERFTAGAPL